MQFLKKNLKKVDCVTMKSIIVLSENRERQGRRLKSTEKSTFLQNLWPWAQKLQTEFVSAKQEGSK